MKLNTHYTVINAFIVVNNALAVGEGVMHQDTFENEVGVGEGTWAWAQPSRAQPSRAQPSRAQPAVKRVPLTPAPRRAGRLHDGGRHAHDI